jgi:acetyl-CoA acetyltransferase
MIKLRRKVYMAAGYNTISMGTGRKEFHPKKPRPDLEDYIKEAGQAVLKVIGGAENVDETVFGNFIASRFNNQGHIAGFAPYIDEGLRYKPSVRVEGACGTGALALITGIRSILAETAEVALVVGVEVQNSVKAIYGADILAAAGWAKERKTGHAYFFPGKFSDRSKAYAEKFGPEKPRAAMAKWYENAITNARLCPTAQEYHNTTEDLIACGIDKPNPKGFVDSLNYFDCSKVSDGASAIAILSEEGLKRCGISKKDAVEIIGFGQAEEDITRPPADPTKLSTTRVAIQKAFESAGVTKDQIGTVECHDCFTIAGIMAIEAMGLAEYGKGPDFVLEGNTTREGTIPFNTTGGLIGWGHPTGATGVHQAVTIWEQLTVKAGDAQIKINPEKPYGLSINMGGDDISVISIVYRKAE